MRQRPLPTALPPPGVDYVLINLETEVRSAIALGLDGFVVDLLGYGPKSPHWPLVLKLMEAATLVDPGFRILLLPDMTTSTFKPENDLTGDNLTNAMRELAASPAAFRLDGKLVVSPYNAHRRPAEWWLAWIMRFDQLSSGRVFFMPLLQNWPAYFGKFAAFSGGVTDWGTREAGPGTGNYSPKWHDFSCHVHAIRPGFLSMASVWRRILDPRTIRVPRLTSASGNQTTVTIAASPRRMPSRAVPIGCTASLGTTMAREPRLHRPPARNVPFTTLRPTIRLGSRPVVPRRSRAMSSTTSIACITARPPSLQARPRHSSAPAILWSQTRCSCWRL